MNIEEFKTKYAAFKDTDKIQIQCDHHNHIPFGEIITIGKQPAKRNILKSGSKEFICRQCFMKYNNPVNKIGEKRQDDSIIEVFCPCQEHNGEPSRQMKKSCYYGSMEPPYLQICGSCVQKGREISDEQKERIRLSLTGIKRSDEFKEKLSVYMKNNPEGIARAKSNLIPGSGGGWNEGLNLSEETKQKMSESHMGKKFSEEHCQKISEGRKKMLEETGGFTPEHRMKLSQATIRQYQNGFDPKTHHIRGVHHSTKIPSGQGVFRSSYEKKAFMILDNDESVVSYEIEKITIKYFNPIKKIDSLYVIDILVKHKDGTSKLIEVKPQSWLLDSVIQAKIEAGKIKAAEIGLPFEVWTEMDLFGHVYNKKNMELFMEKILSEVDKNRRIKISSEKSKRYYHTHIANDKITLFCSFCNEEHTPLRLTHDKNIARNGRYICEREGGHITGSRAKPHLQKNNPHVAYGKKECVNCLQILEFKLFSPDNSKSDGLCRSCKICRSKKAKEKYNKKTK
ncbi:MAG: TnsA endonuclease N-terminal domain-containing protein [Chryseobacterium sp.]